MTAVTTSNNTLLIGDTHGNFELYARFVHFANHRNLRSIHLGDFGLGFHSKKEMNVQNFLSRNSEKHKVIRGNHDNPRSFQGHSWYLGDYGFAKSDPENGRNGSLFWVSGAFSIDGPTSPIANTFLHTRRHGVDWWEDEELSYQDLSCAITLYEMCKPDTVISHDCPNFLIRDVLRARFGDSNSHVFATRTSLALEAMFEKHQPKQWFFGHYHVPFEMTVRGTKFVCVNMDQYTEAEI